MNFKKVISLSAILFLLYLFHLMVLITWQYFPLNKNVVFLELKDQKDLLFYQISFFIHIYSSTLVLLIGFIQFVKFIRIKYSKIHQTIGKTYVLLVLFLAAPSGFIMGIYGNGGLFSQISFVLQAILWFLFTFLAYKYILNKNFKKHYEMMLFSYALTLSAISLRLFKWLIVYFWELPPMDTYKIVVWLGWVFNLIVVYLFLNQKLHYLKMKQKLTNLY